MAAVAIWLVYAGLVCVYQLLKSSYRSHSKAPPHNAVLPQLLFGVSWCVIKYFEDPLDKSSVVTFVATCGVFITLCCCFLIPADVYSLSLDDRTNLAAAIKTLYYGFFIVLVVLSFLVIPFAYFYYEAETTCNTTGERVWAAVKYTLVFIFAAVVLVGIGLIIELGRKGSKSASEWLKPLLDAQADGETAFKVLMGTILFMGLLLWVYVSARGLAVLAVSMFVDTEKRERWEQYGYAAEPDEAWQETLLTRAYRNRSVAERRSSSYSSIRKTLGKIKYPIGLIFIAISLSIVVSILMTNVDKTLHGVYEHGYFVNNPTWQTPLDRVLSFANSTFPVDYLIFGLLALYVLCASLTALVKYGNRWLLVYVYPIRYRRSCPQSLLLTTLNIIYITLVLMTSVITMAPQYATFGNQSIYNPLTNTSRPCALPDINSTTWKDQCQMSQIGVFVYTTTADIPLLGVALLAGDWVFVLAFFFWAYWYVHWEEDISKDVRRRYRHSQGHSTVDI